mgnify:CR=1 FL=1
MSNANDTPAWTHPGQLLALAVAWSRHPVEAHQPHAFLARELLADWCALWCEAQGYA